MVEADDAAVVVERAHERGLLLHAVDSGLVSLSLDEESAADLRDGVFPLADLIEVLGGTVEGEATVSFGSESSFEPALARTSAFLTHPVFSTHHSETAMMRYLRQLPTATTRSTAG